MTVAAAGGTINLPRWVHSDHISDVPKTNIRNLDSLKNQDLQKSIILKSSLGTFFFMTYGLPNFVAVGCNRFLIETGSFMCFLAAAALLQFFYLEVEDIIANSE